MKMVKCSVVCVAALVMCLPMANAQISETSNPAAAITSSTCSGTDGQGGVTDTVTFAQAGTIDDVNISVDIDHTWRSDLQMSVVYNSVRTLLGADQGGFPQENYYALFDDDAAALCSDATQCGSGSSICDSSANRATCQPDESLDTNYATLGSTLGAWTLEVCDDASGDEGTLQSWTVTLDGTGLPVELMTFSVE
jgi:hypothetical protein